MCWVIYQNMLTRFIISQHIHVNIYKMYFLLVLLIFKCILFIIHHFESSTSQFRLLLFLCDDWIRLFSWWRRAVVCWTLNASALWSRRGPWRPLRLCSVRGHVTRAVSSGPVETDEKLLEVWQSVTELHTVSVPHTHTQPRHVRSLCAEDPLLPPAGPPRPARRHAQTLQPGRLRSAAADSGLRGRPLGLRSLGVPRAGPGHREGDNPGGRLRPGGGQAGCGRCVQGVSFLEAVHC